MVLNSEKAQSLLKINRDILKEDGSLKSFKEQLLEYKFGMLSEETPLVILPDTNVLQIQGLTSAPLVINQEIFKHIEKGHDVSALELLDLKENIENYVLAIDSQTQENSIVVILGVKNKDEEFLVVPIHLSKSFRAVEIHSVRSVYGKERIGKWILRAYDGNLRLYSNEKTEIWLKSLGVQFPQRLINSLSLNNCTKKYVQCQEEKKDKNRSGGRAR